MRTKLSTKGQVVLPEMVRRCLGLQTGDTLKIGIERGRVVLTPEKKSPHRVRRIVDPATGFPALTAGADAPTLTSKQVREILADFP